MELKVENSLSVSGKIKMTFRNVLTGEIRISSYSNLVVNTGKYMLAKRLNNEANDCNLTYCAVGTGTDPPSTNDTTLQTEYYRKVVSSYSRTENITTISTYFGPSVANTTLKEVALFGEAASATPDSGTMFNRAAINEIKTSAETLTIDCSITFV